LRIYKFAIPFSDLRKITNQQSIVQKAKHIAELVIITNIKPKDINRLLLINYPFFPENCMFLEIRQVEKVVYSEGFHLFFKDGIPFCSSIKRKKTPKKESPELSY